MAIDDDDIEEEDMIINVESSSKPKASDKNAEEEQEIPEIEKKMNELRQLKAPKKESGAKAAIFFQNMYQKSFFIKIVGLLDFYTSLAQSSPAVLALIKSVVNPRRLNLLL